MFGMKDIQIFKGIVQYLCCITCLHALVIM